MVASPSKGPEYKLQNIIALIMETHRVVPLISGTPPYRDYWHSVQQAVAETAVVASSFTI